MKRFRVPFFIKLYEALQSDGIQLRVAYSQATASEASKDDNSELPEAIGLKVRGRWSAGNKLLYQPLLGQILGADLVIVEQASKHILNVILLGMSRLRVKKVAFWGHGRNRQGSRNTFGEHIKMHTVSWVDWWFAYTRGVQQYVVGLGVPSDRVTAVYNSVDTSDFQRSLSAVTPDQLREVRHELSISESAKVGLYCGGLYCHKHVDFLIEAADLIHQALPQFRLIVLGGGPERSKIECAANKYPWIIALGPRFGAEKALYFRLANVFLMPGLVGLAILDAFASGLPLLTTDIPIHSPEVEYLENGVNGFMTIPDLRTYADKVISVLNDVFLLNQLASGAEKSALRYSIESMVRNFRSGILSCLSMPYHS